MQGEYMNAPITKCSQILVQDMFFHCGDKESFLLLQRAEAIEMYYA